MVRIACGLSAHVHPLKALEQAVDQCREGLHGAQTDLAIIFFTSHHLEAARAIAYALKRRLGPRVLLGVSARSVLCSEREVENSPAVSLFTASLPGVELHPFRGEALMSAASSADADALRAAAGFGPAHRATILLADPTSVPLNTVLPAMAAARVAPRHGAPRGLPPIVGGIASASTEPGKNALIFGEEVLRQGCVGVSLSGRLRVDALVSQGCRPVGPPLVVTGGRGQIVTGLGGRPALQTLSEVLDTLDDHGKQLMQRGGLFIGRAVSEYKERFGRDDFVIRPVLGVDRNSEAIAVGDLLRIGQTVQLHVRDAETAHEDLEMLLDIQRLHGPPAGALLFSCNGRGNRLFGKPDHDATAVARAFVRSRPGEETAKPGSQIPGDPAILPLAGFFAAGEIGPLGDEVFVHGHTACAAFFRGIPPNTADV